MSDRSADPVLIHFYRAVVSHMDVWRQRMDATTNWAAATSAGMITFTFGTTSAPHYVLLIALAFQLVFLLMESRRYQIFDLWRRRFRTLNRSFIVPSLAALPPADDAALEALARDLGRTVPHLSLLHAVGYRVRRNYGYLFVITLVGWLLKLEMQPEPARSVAGLLDRATIAFLPGWLVLGVVIAGMTGALWLALIATGSDILDWEDVAPPLHRWTASRRGGRPGAMRAKDERGDEEGMR